MPAPRWLPTLLLSVTALVACGSSEDTPTTSAATTTLTTGGESGTAAAEPTTGDATSEPVTTQPDDTGTTTTTGTPSTTTGESTGTTADPSSSGDETGGCISCSESFSGGKGPLCAPSQALLDTLFMCICGTCDSVCNAQCTMGAPQTTECQSCQNDAFDEACNPELQACLADT